MYVLYSENEHPNSLSASESCILVMSLSVPRMLPMPYVLNAVAILCLAQFCEQVMLSQSNLVSYLACCLSN